MRAMKVFGVVVAMAVASLVAAGSASAAPMAAAAAAIPVTAPAAPAAPGPQAAAARTAVPTRVQGTPCLSTASACVELRTNRAWLLRDGVVVYGPVPITHGRKGFATPRGTFRVSFKNRDHVSSKYNAAMPYSVFFNGGIAFHHGSLKQKSHGCIHLSRTAAKKFFGSLSRGHVVQVV
jgi:hypothetical protein